jgi:hypothetical protein
MPCKNHKKNKRGRCTDCNVCIYCSPAAECVNPLGHKNEGAIKGRPNKRVIPPKVVSKPKKAKVGTIQTPTAPPRCRAAVVIGGRPVGYYKDESSPESTTPLPPQPIAEAAVSNRKILHFTGVDTPERKTLELERVLKSPLKQKLVKLLDALGLDTESATEFPSAGYSPQQVKDTKGRTHRRAKKVYIEIMEAVNSLFCVEDSSLCSST